MIALPLLLVLCISGRGLAAADRPQVVLWIVADDLGTDDVPFTNTGCEIKTPTLSRLAAEGVVLDNYYVNPICTPTRTSFMSGRYPYHVGLQQGVIRDAVRNALPLNETVIAQHIRDAGYRTHIVGKWHLGFYEHKYTPEMRGFETHFGYYTGNEDYWAHLSPCWNCGNYTAVDFHTATNASFEAITNKTGIYSTNIFAEAIEDIIHRHDASEPLFIYAPFEAVHGAASCYTDTGEDCSNPAGDLLQAPEYYIQQQSHIPNMQRRTFAGMVGALDDAVKNITAALQSKGLLDDTLLIFTTDNGAPDTHFGGGVMSNYPLRGGKGTLFEGGVKGASFVHGWGLKNVAGTRNKGMLHAADWYLTLANVTGARIPEHTRNAVDGYDVWGTLSQNKASPRHTMVHNIHADVQAGIRVGDLKLLYKAGKAGWGPNPRNMTSNGPRRMEEASSDYLLFNITADPQERHDLSQSEPKLLQSMLQSLKAMQASEVPCRNPDPDDTARPEPIEGLVVCFESYCNNVGVWKPWVSGNSSCPCKYQENMDLYPSTHQSLAASSKEECCQLCQADTHCAASVFSGDKCYLKPHGVSPRPRQGSLSCMPQPC